MAGADPTYPLYPITCLLSSAMLLLVLLSSFVRQSWNLGVAFLCFWLFIENLTEGIDAIVWSDNSDVKLYIYCDIVTHMQMITLAVKPMATLIIIRRLYLITNLQSVELPDKSSRRRNLAVEWTLGLFIPLLVAGPLYYVVQGARFKVIEVFGCQNTPDFSVLGILLQNAWTVIPPLISIIFYYPRIIRILYRQKREMDQFLRSNNSVSRMNYYRIFALASIDVVLTLPFGITNIVLNVTETLSVSGYFPLYSGWTFLHTDWEPLGVPYSELVAEGTSELAGLYFSFWTSPILAFAIFGLFGVTAEARASYWRVICTIGGTFGWKLKPPATSQLDAMEFGERPRGPSVDLEIGYNPSFINENAREKHVAGEGVERESGLDVEKAEGSGQGTGDEISNVEHGAGKREHLYGDVGFVDATNAV